MKKFLLFLFILSIPAFLATGQSSELTVEESYLQESVVNMIIREQARAESREMKLIAMEYIADAIADGNTSDDVRQALEYMGLEGILNRSRENGRLVNNFPDVRKEAARHLGAMKTEEARDVLLRMIYYENEPMVLVEAVKSLTDINLEDNGRTISAIAWMAQKFDNTTPDNVLALAAIEAFEKIGGGNVRDPNAIQMLIRISDGPYFRVVQERAQQALLNIRRAQVQRQQEQQAQQQRQ